MTNFANSKSVSVNSDSFHVVKEGGASAPPSFNSVELLLRFGPRAALIEGGAMDSKPEGRLPPIKSITILLIAIPLLSACLISFHLVGKRDTGDYKPVLDLSVISSWSSILAVIAVIALLACVIATASIWRRSLILLLVVLFSIFNGSFAGLTLRIISAQTYGANIGAGLALSILLILFAIMVIFDILALRRVRTIEE